MTRRDRGHGLRAFGGTALLAALLLLGPPALGASAELSLATGGAAGADQKVGAALCRLYNDARAAPAPLCGTKTSAGSVANIAALRAASTQLALVQADVAAAAAHGSAPFGGRPPFASLRVLMALQPELFTVLARRDAGIARFADLKGRRVAVGPRGSGGRATLGKVLQYYGWAEEQAFSGVVELAPAEASAALCAGRVDALVDVVAHPDPLIGAAAQGCAARLAGVTGPQIDHLLKRYVVYRATAIRDGVYPGTATATPTIGTRMLLVAAASLDPEIASRLVKVALAGIAGLRAAHPSLEGVTPSDLVPRGDAIAIHPGAEAAFRAAGIDR